MKRLILLLAIGSMAFASSCTHTSKAGEEATVAARDFSPVDGKAVVYLYRPGKFVAGGVMTPIKVNGLDAGGTGPGTFFRWELPPGVYTFSAQNSASTQMVQVDAKAGEVYYIKEQEHIGVASRDTRISMKETTAKEAQPVIKKGKLLLSNYTP
ncbi:DUF2846 domain-containing protein [Cryomorphaceae bacterium]|nr:DUF2846 domain-containing protein [Cryomorphaceae bacterium]